MGGLYGPARASTSPTLSSDGIGKQPRVVHDTINIIRPSLLRQPHFYCA